MRQDSSQRGYRPQHDDGRHPSHGGGNRSVYAPWVKYAVAAAAVLLVIVIVLAARGCTPSQKDASGSSTVARTDTGSTSSAKKSSKKSGEAKKKAKTGFAAIPTGASVQTFNTKGGDAPTFTHGELASLKMAITAAENSGDVGVVFYDLSSGKGVSYNADLEVYGASGFKAPYALYICEQLVEAGDVKLDEPLSSYDEDSTLGSETVGDLIQAAIVNSDNDSYIALREAFDGKSYDEWAKKLDIEEARAEDGGVFPTYCARTSAKVWAEMDSYLSTNDDTSKWLAEQLKGTAMSFIRSGITGEATVYDKAGWINEDGYAATCDSGLVQIDGHTYVMSIMTTIPWDDSSADAVEQIAAALVEARGNFA